MPTQHRVWQGGFGVIGSLAMRRVLLLALAAGIFGACTLTPVAATTGMVTGHIYGTPGCPATVQGTNCPPLLMGNLTVTFTASDGSSKVARTDLDGSYTISLAPGKWQVRMRPDARLLNGPSEVDVRIGARTVADFTVDSRVR